MTVGEYAAREVHATGYEAGYEQAVSDAQDALTRLLTGSSLSFGDLQGMRLALIVIGQISPDTKQIDTAPHRPQTV